MLIAVDAALRELLRDLGMREDAQGADEHRALAQHLELVLGGAADAQDHVGIAVQGRRVGHDARARLGVRRVDVRGCLSGAGLDEHLEPIGDELAGDLGREGDARLAFGGLARYSDLHSGRLSVSRRAHGEPPQLEGRMAVRISECSRTDGGGRTVPKR